MNICVGINNLKIGGAERLVVDLCNQWQQAGHRLWLTTITSECAFPEIHRLIPPERRLVLGRMSHFRQVIKLAFFLRKHKIQAAVFHLEEMNQIGILAARLDGIPALCTMHSVNLYKKGCLAEKRSAFLYNHFATKVIAISETVADYLTAMGVKKRQVVTIANGVDRKRYHEKYQYAPQTSCLKLLFIGRLQAVKGLNFMLDALAIFNRKYSNWEFTIVGDGDERTSLETQAINLKMLDKVHFVGASNDPWDYLSDHSLLCLPSLREGLPMVLLEALAIGVPVLCSKVGYLPKLVGDDNGFLVAPGNSAEILDMLCRISHLNTEQLKLLGRAAFQKVVPYDLKKCALKYLETLVK